ncbi:uncharacterized protein LOC120523824 isoform X4 [Polypterus senegalus]|uniref:uncharacterized protein LOC120523824 isoform X4 n=1 Tax=Polypterus senegalus TaxID=55291 RepID=UPI001965C100|nr:uncharacterized protein LOC120523824 isoform X4 [Polypterus senegalus]
MLKGGRTGILVGITEGFIPGQEAIMEGPGEWTRQKQVVPPHSMWQYFLGLNLIGTPTGLDGKWSLETQPCLTQLVLFKIFQQEWICLIDMMTNYWKTHHFLSKQVLPLSSPPLFKEREPASERHNSFSEPTFFQDSL